MNKNEEYVVTIEDMGSDGEGIGHISVNEETEPDRKVTVFVKDTVVGDEAKVKIIKVKKSFVYGRLMEIIKPSPYRVRTACDYAKSCGGCFLMHMSYEKQLEYKFNKVKNCLERIGGIKEAEALMEQVCGMETPYNFRNKMQFPVGLGKDGKVKIGFYAGRTHSIIDIDECVIGHEVNTFIIKNIRKWIDAKLETDKNLVYNEELHKGLIRHIVTRIGYTTGELSICVVINGDGLKKKLSDEMTGCFISAVEEYNSLKIKDEGEKVSSKNDETKLNISNGAGSYFHASDKVSLASVSLNINKEKTNKILGDKSVTIYGRDYIKDYIGDICFDISPQSFYQVNPIQTKVLYDKALSYAGLTGNETVWDMYCGIGTISLFLAKKAKKVYGVEIIPSAIEDAKKNAIMNGLGNTEFYCGKAEEVVPKQYEENGIKSDVIVVDPPRKGCDATLLDTISDMSPERLVYVSCDPATLARDIRYLGEKGFKVKKVAVVDQFCHSVHVESVVLMSKLNV